MKVSPAVSVQLDTMRGISALVVLVAHAYQLLIPQPQHVAIAGLFSQAAVMVFFVLSGFLICNSIQGNTARNGTFSPASYAADRFNRIVPPLLLATALVLALWHLAPLSGVAFETNLEEQLGSLLFLNGFLTKQNTVNGPLWSLAYEVWYYAAAGLIATLRGRRGLVAAAVLLCALGYLNHRFLLFSVVWFAGCWISLGRPINRLAGWASLSLACVFAVLHLRGFDPRAIFFYNLFAGLFFASVLYRIVREELRVPALFPRSADFSYTLYIVHFPLMLFVAGFAQGLSVAVAASIGCVLLAHTLSGVEKWRPLKTSRIRLTAS